MHLPISLLASLRQRFEKILPIHVVQKNILLPVSAAHHVIHGSRIFNAQFSRHGPLDFGNEEVKQRNA
jgi:hypothetical protein